MAAKRSKKDKQMAAYLKKIKDSREYGRCPVCYKIAKNGTHPGAACFSRS